MAALYIFVTVLLRLICACGLQGASKEEIRLGLMSGDLHVLSSGNIGDFPTDHRGCRKNGTGDECEVFGTPPPRSQTDEGLS